MSLDEVFGWMLVVVAAGVYVGLWVFLGMFVLGTMVSGWGPHDHLKLREVLVPLWCVLAGDEEVTARLTAILDRRQEAAQAAPEPRHALPRGIRPERYLLDPDDIRVHLRMRRWPPYL